MNVLEVLHFYLPAHSAGTEVYTHGLSKELLRRGHQVAVLATDKLLAHRNYSVFERAHDGVPCHVLVNNLLYRRFEETFDNPTVEARFTALLDALAPDVVHFQHLWMLSLGLPWIARERGIATVMTLHDFWLFCPRMGQLLEHGETLCSGPEIGKCARCVATFPYRQKAWQAALIAALSGVRRTTGLDLTGAVEQLRARAPTRRTRCSPRAPPEADPRAAALEPALAARRRRVERLFGEVDWFVSPSRTVRDLAVEHGLPEDRIEVLPNGVAPPARQPARRPGPRTVFGFLGTIVPHKGLHVLLEAVERLGVGAIELRVAGSGRYAPAYDAQMRARSAQLGAHHAGPLDREGVAEFLAAIDVLVVPSLWMENAPVVIQEARQQGATVLASRLGGMAEAVEDGVDGVLFTLGDAADLAEQLARLDADHAVVERLQRAGRPPESLADHAARIETLYARLHEERRT
jgi:glycosyltransferase involved in cell wall biosynthesis